MKSEHVETDIIAQASIIVNGSIDQVWDALINPAAIKQYMFGATVESDWKEGSPIVWKGEWQGKKFEDKGEILRLEPKQLFQYSHYSPMSGQDDIPSNYHTVTIALVEEDQGVWVALTQDKNNSAQAREHSEKNWNMMLQGLKKYVESRSTKVL